MKYRILSVLMVLILLTGCASQAHYSIRQDLSIYFTNADQIITAIRNSLRKHDQKIIIYYSSHGDNMEDINVIVRELMKYALEETDDPTEGDYIFHQYGGYEMHYSYQKQEDLYQYEIEIIPEYYTTLTQEQEVSEQIRQVLAEMDFHIWTSDYEKIRKIYDYICEHVDYDVIHKKNKYYHLKATAYGALIYHHAVCQGYAVAMYRLLREAGIDARVITGTAELTDGSTEFHAWNLVRIGNVYYNLDATWKTEDYFLKTDADFKFHVRDPEYQTESFYQAYPMAEKSY